MPKIYSDAECSSMVYDFDEAKRIAEKLSSKYPGHLWSVTVNQGVALIHNLALSGKWGFAIKLKNIDNDYKAVIRAGGEILERYNIYRGKLIEQEFLDIPRDFALRPIGDYSK